MTEHRCENKCSGWVRIYCSTLDTHYLKIESRHHHYPRYYDGKRMSAVTLETKIYM